MSTGVSSGSGAATSSGTLNQKTTKKRHVSEDNVTNFGGGETFGRSSCLGTIKISMRGSSILLSNN